MTTTTSTHLFLFLIVTCFQVEHVFSQDATVSFSVLEETQFPHYLGSVALESRLFTNISNDEFQRLQFQILRPGNKYIDMFDIETDTSLLWTNKVIDREDFISCLESCFVDFNVAVYQQDTPEPINIIKVVVEIEDFNDNAPMFSPDQQEIIVSESASLGSELLRRAAVDLDQGAGNSVQTYSMFPDNDMFEIETINNEEKEFRITLKTALDHETVTFYQVVVLAKDGGTPQLTGTLSVGIKVTDYNDNSPEFTEEMYEIEIQENVQINFTILLLYASDKDEGENAKITYKFSQRVPDKIIALFNINETTGEVTVAGPIDYETNQQFEFQVLAVDNGSPARTSTAYVVIKVIDINDNSPQINLNQPPGGIVISETATIDSFVTHVEIIDLDDGKNGLVTCSLLDEHFRIVKFEIENNYKIVLTKLLDHETQSSHNVSIVCQDSGDLPKQSFANFIVHVEDQNDNYPVFLKEIYSVAIEENNAKRAVIVDVSATDADSGSYGQISYSIQSSSVELFSVNSFTGVIMAEVSLDREVYGDQRIFQVMAKDGGNPPLNSTATVVIKILDQNDNDPNFDKDLFVLNISESAPKDTVVGNVSAKDPDKEMNGTFYLKFPDLPNVTEYFYFNESGFIMTNKELDRETAAKHEFYVHAIDMGGRTSSALVVIHVKDVNDNVPQIIYPSDNYVLPFLYSSPVGSLAVHVIGEDRDVGDNAKLYYYLHQHNSTYSFLMNEISGKMILNSTIDAKDIGKIYNFLILVKDGGKPPLSALTTVNIQLTAGQQPLESSSAQSNFWIVIAIVAVTFVLSAIMVAVILKICWVNRKKDGSCSSSNIILESGEVNPKLIDSSSSSSSTSSKDSNANAKLKIGDIYPADEDGFQHSGTENQQCGTGYQLGQDETGSLINTTLSSVDKNMDRLYMEKVKELSYDLQKKTDETNSDNSGEMGTRDSGQGGSDVDIISLSELPILDIPDVNTYTDSNATSSSRHYLTGNHSNKLYSTSDSGSYSNQSTIENSYVPKTLGNYHVPPLKTAERKELAKIKRGQKRVMFSDDLEHSHSSGRSSTMSTLSYSDINNLVQSVGSPRLLNRLYSHDPTISTERLQKSFPLHRSVDNLTSDNNHGNRNRQLPSYQNRYSMANISEQVPETFNGNLQVQRQPEQNFRQVPNRNFTARKDDPSFPCAQDYQRSSSSHENDSTTTSGSYSLILDELSMSPMDNVFPSDLYV